MINSKSFLVNTFHLRYIIESRMDEKKEISYTVRTSDYAVRFRSLESVIDFIKMNEGSIGFMQA